MTSTCTPTSTYMQQIIDEAAALGLATRFLDTLTLRSMELVSLVIEAPARQIENGLDHFISQRSLLITATRGYNTNRWRHTIQRQHSGTGSFTECTRWELRRQMNDLATMIARATV